VVPQCRQPRPDHLAAAVLGRRPTRERDAWGREAPAALHRTPAGPSFAGCRTSKGRYGLIPIMPELAKGGAIIKNGTARKAGHPLAGLPLAETLESTHIYHVAGLTGARTVLVTTGGVASPPELKWSWLASSMCCCTVARYLLQVHEPGLRDAEAGIERDLYLAVITG
jgi:hypothetical protein